MENKIQTKVTEKSNVSAHLPTVGTKMKVTAPRIDKHEDQEERTQNEGVTQDL